MGLYTDRPSLNPKLHPFDLSHNHFTTMNFGYLYPAMWQECVPGDIFQLEVQALVRALPLVAPILNNMTLSLNAFFVPHRIVWKNYEKFFTTIDNDVIPPVSFDELPPLWMQNDAGIFADASIDVSTTSLWRAFGLNVQLSDNVKSAKLSTLKDYLPTDLLRRSYYKIWNDWYRDENFQEPIDYQDNNTTFIQSLMRRAWEKDYFTAALYSRQKGTAPSVPISINGSISFNVIGDSSSFDPTLYKVTNIGAADGGLGSSVPVLSSNPSSAASDWSNFLSANNVTAESAGFDMSDIRDMAAIQKQMEGLMIYGSKYIEVLQGVYGTSPTDERLQLAERLGGMTFNVRVSEVLQTSSSTDTSVQGNQTGHALGVSQGKLISYKCDEPGYIIVLADIKPPAVYRNRFPRELFRKSRLDVYSPYFVNLSFQAVHNYEIYGQLTSDDLGVWAYQGRYDEMRTRMSYVTGQLVDTMEYYLSVRRFTSLPAMNGDFISCNPDDDIFAVVDEDKFICNFYFDLKALRPLPPYSEPGLVDHVYGG